METTTEVDCKLRGNYIHFCVHFQLPTNQCLLGGCVNSSKQCIRRVRVKSNGKHIMENTELPVQMLQRIIQMALRTFTSNSRMDGSDDKMTGTTDCFSIKISLCFQFLWVRAALLHYKEWKHFVNYTDFGEFIFVFQLRSFRKSKHCSIDT